MARWAQILGLGLIALSTACTTPGPAPLKGPSSADRAAAELAGYELGPVRSARDLLPPHIVTGLHHRVEDPVVNDGYANHYSISSDFGDFEAHGDAQLRTRIDEIEALAALAEMSMTNEFARAAGRALASPFVATWNLVTHPVDSVRGVPEAAWETLLHTSAIVRSERGELEDSGLVALIGFEDKKRQIAGQLGVDPYTSNQLLQTQLNRFAWAAYAGGLPFILVPFVDESDLVREPDLADSDEEEPGDRIGEILREYSPEDLRRLNRIELALMGISEPLRDEFIRHPWYSPRHETVLVDALAGLGLGADRSRFIEVAIGAESEDDARFYLHTAQLLRTYHDRVTPIQRILAVDGRLFAYSEDGALVSLLPADHAVWSPSTAALARSFAAPLPGNLPVERSALVLSGTISRLARDHMGELGIEVIEHAFTELTSSESE